MLFYFRKAELLSAFLLSTFGKLESTNVLDSRKYYFEHYLVRLLERPIVLMKLSMGFQIIHKVPPMLFPFSDSA